MLGESDYKDLAPYLPMLRMYKDHGINVGFDVHSFKKIYDRIANDNLNTGCGGCISDALSRTNDLIDEYKSGHGE